MKILFFTPTAELGASSRYRVYQYIKHLESYGNECKIEPFLTNELYYLWKSNSLKKIMFEMPNLFFKRLVQCLTVHKYDVIFIHRDIFPFGPMIFEKIVRLLNKNIIVDIDDAVFTNEIEEIGSSNKIMYKLKYGKRFNSSFKVSKLIICGNEYLQEKVNKINDSTAIIPTVVDISNIYPKTHSDTSDTVTIGWVGNPGNSNYLKQLVNIFKNLTRTDLNEKVKLKFIGANENIKDFFEGVEVEIYPWSLETEYDLLKQCDIGIMPLNDSTWSKGKCGLKLLQYMAIGIPVIASPVGVNQKIVDDGYNGYLAANEEEWENKLKTLIVDSELRRKMGENGRTFVVENYSLDKWSQTLNEIIKSLK